MDAHAAEHPTEQTLSSFALGKLDDASSEAVNKHLEQCPDCRKRASEVSADGFLERVRGAAARPESLAAMAAPVAGVSLRAGGPTSPAPSPASTLPPGLAEHADYEILRELGRGGMGVVYLARNKLMGRAEVLKVVGGHLIERPGVRDRFLREVQSAAKLHHKNIVTAYSAIRLSESIVLAMEYVEGDDLAKVVKSGGPLPVVHACYFIYQAALGLQHAHERGMVHRDIKPANLILAREGKRAVVKVLDFGLAKVTREGQADSGLTREGQMLGTPDFIAPEQIRDAQSADIRADIYSLGCTFYYLLTGEPPFRGDSLWDVYQAHFSMDAGPLNLVRPEVPVELAALVAKMMAKEPGRRFQTPGEVAQALVPFFRPSANPGSRPSPEISRVRQAAPSPQPVGGGSAPAQPETPGTAPAPAPRGPSKPNPEGVAWESLIEFKEPERSVAPVKPKPALKQEYPSEAAGAQAPVRRPPWRSRRMVAGAAGCAGILFGIIILITIEKNRVTVDVRRSEAPGKAQRHIGGSPPGSARRPDQSAAGKPSVPPSAPEAETAESRSKSDRANAWSRLMAKLGRQSSGPAPYACWTFESDARDEIGTMHGRPIGGAKVRGGRLYLDGKAAAVKTDPLTQDVREKTLEAWVLLGNLDQRGGGVISIEYAPTFDTIAFGEREPKKWIAGSEWFRRTLDLNAPDEHAKPTDPIHMAIVYDREGGITVYREGKRYADRYVPRGGQATLSTYPAGQSYVLLGQRATRALDNPSLTGAIEEARLYDRALTAGEVAASFRAGVIHYTTGNGVEKVSGTAAEAARNTIEIKDQSAADRDVKKVDKARGNERIEGKTSEQLTKNEHPVAAVKKPGARRARPSRAVDGEGTSGRQAPKTIRNSIGMTLALIPAGTFLMGSPDDAIEAENDEKPSHRVGITKPFYLGVTEVTQAQYKAVMGNNPSSFSANGTFKDRVAGQSTDRYPVEMVSWLDAVQFCNKLTQKEGKKPFYEIDGQDVRVPDWRGQGYRLPTEAEWEYACRANAFTPTRFSFGDNVVELERYGWFDANSVGQTHPVSQKRPNGFGLYDMHGNVFEWCWDWYGAPNQGPADDPTGPAGALDRVFRGGSWSYPPRFARSAARVRLVPIFRGDNLGLRLALGQSGR